MEFAVVYTEKITSPLMPSSMRFGVLNTLGAIAPEDVGDDELMEKLKAIHDEEYIRKMEEHPLYRPALENLRCILQGMKLLDEYDVVIVPITAAGHLAERGRMRGYCIFNGMSLAMKEAMAKYSRVAGIETDAHHGNSPEDVKLFCIGDRECRILDDLRCVLGREIGKKYVEAFTEMLKRVREYDPDVIIWYLGLDLHELEYAEMKLSRDDFASLADAMAELIKGRKAVILLASGSRSDVVKETLKAVITSLTGRLL